MPHIVTKENRINDAEQFIESITEPANSVYYVFLGKHTPYNTSDRATRLYDNEELSKTAYRDMISGKRVTQNDVNLVINREDYEYSADTVYDMYDDTDKNLSTKKFYTIVEDGVNYRVYKCLYNNNGSPSTVSPSGTANTYTETADGYIWKYMYTVTDTIVNKFSTPEYFPVGTSANVIASAAPGSIDVIKVTDAGSDYENYVAGQFSSADIRLSSNDVLFSINSNNNSSVVNGFYNGCIFEITQGTGAGQHAYVMDYFVNTTFKTVRLDRVLTTMPDQTSTFEISPAVMVVGDGGQTINCVAKAVVNSVGNTINRVEIIERGQDYKTATAYINVSDLVGATDGSVRPIISPRFGHGADPASELYATKLCISVKFSNTESNTIIAKNDFRQIGLLKDPKYANVVIEFDTTTSTQFVKNEKLLKISPKRVFCINVSVNNSVSNVRSVGNVAYFDTQFAANDFVYLTNGTYHQLAVVNSVTNSTQLVLQNTFGYFTATNTQVFIANTSAEGFVTNATTTNVTVANLVGTLQTGDIIIGLASGARATVNSISIDDNVRNFNTFNQMYKLQGNLVSGTFTNDELVYGNNISVDNGLLHSVIGASNPRFMYVTNYNGSINIGDVITGNVSGAKFLVSAVYKPDIVFNSGKIMYLENIDNAVTRSNTTSEQIKLIFQY